MSKKPQPVRQQARLDLTTMNCKSFRIIFPNLSIGIRVHGIQYTAEATFTLSRVMQSQL